jgi:hypothetical protein
MSRAPPRLLFALASSFASHHIRHHRVVVVVPQWHRVQFRCAAARAHIAQLPAVRVLSDSGLLVHSHGDAAAASPHRAVRVVPRVSFALTALIADPIGCLSRALKLFLLWIR